MRTEFTKLLKQFRTNHPDVDDDLLRRAYRTANKAHEGQLRLSGEPYVSHSLAVANILAQLGLDQVTLSAALLHDVLEDTPVTLDELQKEFGDVIAQLVDGVTKIGTMPTKTDVVVSDEVKQAENLRKMLVATAKDVRVILIKLTDRLHNLRTIEFLPQHKIRRICTETLDIYAPMANRLGLSQWKWEMEDHAFHYLDPEGYKETAKRVSMKRRERERVLNQAMQFLEVRLEEGEVNARVIGRPKHLYSIYQKMQTQAKTFDQILDVMAVRIITQTVSGCYNALGVIHHLWLPVPGRFKDYIAMPKMNMYQSIHTTVMMEDGKALEVQIRSEEMDRTARDGIAAHWEYKSDASKVDAKAKNQLHWLRQMYDWLKDAHAPDGLFDSVRREIGNAAVYAFTPRGEVIELSRGATPLDFAYMIHTDVGHQCFGARVNGAMVPLRYHLQTGDVVEIITSKNQKPHVDWLDVVVTGRARTRIRQKLRELGELPPIGREPSPKDSLLLLSKRSNSSAKASAKSAGQDEAARDSLIRVEGGSDLEVQFAKCCAPMPGQPVIGYITKRQGITIHRAECRFLEGTDRDSRRMVEASWEGDRMVEMALQVTMGSRPNVLADITSAMRPINIDITYAEYRPAEDGDSVFVFVFESPDQTSVDRVIKTLRTVSGVTEVAPLSLPERSTAHA